jgi:hypothetical protein
MGNYWAIAVGINQYSYFQPLNYAQRDAQALRNFWVEEAQIPANQCILLTDGAESALSGALVPRRDRILEQVARICQERLQPDDVLWFFFSGYGMQLKNQDYLMPLDGQPDKLAETAIALEELFQLFAAVPQSHIVIALDVNRSQGTLQGQWVGQQAVALAQEQGRALFLSCAADQFSQETLALRHGFFTAALIEGLRYENCLTPEALDSFLRDRLPELTEHHWRPRQDPVAVLPTTEKYTLILPQEAILYGDLYPESVLESATPLAAAPSSNPQLPAFGRSLSEARSVQTLTPAAVSPPSPTSVSATAQQPLPTGLLVIWRDPFWRSLLIWGGAISLALLIGVVLRNRSVFLPPPADPAPNSAAESETSGGLVAPSTPLQQAIATTPQGNPSSLPEQVAAFNQAIALAQVIPDDDPEYTAAQTYIQRWQVTILDLAQAQASQRDYQGAIASVRSILPVEHPDVQARAQQLIVTWGTYANNQALLERARAIAQPDQASSLNEAIGTARTIPSGQPFYNEAQTAINQWSEEILQLATTRADAGNYELAVRSAQLVPPGTAAYDAAQGAIAEWQELELRRQAMEATLEMGEMGEMGDSDWSDERE